MFEELKHQIMYFLLSTVFMVTLFEEPLLPCTNLEFMDLAIMKHQDAPGTTFKKHMNIARGLLSEDDYLLTEILFNPNTPGQLEQIQKQLSLLQNIIKEKDSVGMKNYLTRLRENIK